MAAVRYVVPLLAALLLASTAGAETPKPKLSLTAPQNLHAFLLRSDEPAADTFPRTPSFAWTPIRGVVRYEFQLSTSNVFRDSGIIFEDLNVKGATVAIPISLPWITGSPYALYARVRAVLPSGAVTPWSQSVGFNMRWPTIPAPLTSYPGLMRWTPVDGANGYQVWLVDAGKVYSTPSNTGDAREYYAFHPEAIWTSTVRWRVRASRILYGTRKNTLPAVSYGPWSPVYTMVNPTFETGTMSLRASASDVVSDAAGAPDAHRLMPGFAFKGNMTVKGQDFELFRVHVFSDKDCVNLVYKGAVVGGPAYAPRSTGPLDLPKDTTELGEAEDIYLEDGDEGKTFYADGMQFVTVEFEKAADPEANADDESGSGSESSGSSGSSGSAGSGSESTGSSGSGSGSGSGSTGSGTDAGSDSDDDATTTASNAGAGTSLPIDPAQQGAPVDLWDTDWPSGGYYWTAVPVQPIPAKPFKTELAVGTAPGATSATVVNAAELETDDFVRIGTGAGEEEVQLLTVDAATRVITFTPALAGTHQAGERVLDVSGEIEYHDMELPQDACAAGRVLRFGKSSEPTVASSTTPFVSGLSPTGRLISAATEKSPVFYGAPLVAWTPALGADAYEVQWSKTTYPWKTEGTYYTFATSASLPIKPGTWHYRVRGVNLSLIGIAQRMGWSDPVKITVASPKFAVLGGAQKASAITKSTTKTAALSQVTVDEEGFAIGVPKGWEVVEQSADSPLLFEAAAAQAEQGFFSNMNVVSGPDRGTLTMTQWAAALKAEVATLPLVAKSLSSKVVKVAAGDAVKLTYKLTTADGRQVSLVQYAIDVGDGTFILTYTTAPSLASKYSSVFAASANSFRLDS